MTDTTRPDGVAEIARRLQACVDDPMWANHAEVNKATLRAAIAALTAQAAKPAEGGAVDEWAAFCNWYSRRHVYEYSRQAKWEAWQARAALAREGGA